MSAIEGIFKVWKRFRQIEKWSYPTGGLNHKTRKLQRERERNQDHTTTDQKEKKRRERNEMMAGESYDEMRSFPAMSSAKTRQTSWFDLSGRHGSRH